MKGSGLMSGALCALAVIGAAMLTGTRAAKGSSGDPAWTGRSFDVRLAPTLPEQGVVGTRLARAMRKFDDDPSNRIVRIAWRGDVEPLNWYGIENREAHGIAQDDYEVSNMTWFRVRVLGSGHPNAMRRTFRASEMSGWPWQPAWHYGNQDQDLAPWDGSADFAGSSGFTVEYGGSWTFPLAVGPFDAPTGFVELEVTPHLVGEFVRQPGSSEGDAWVVLELDAPQWWRWNYQPAWSSWHGFQAFADPGWLDLRGRFVAIHADGSVQDSGVEATP